jgi:His-Xaa-Ser system protein HxsD
MTVYDLEQSLVRLTVDTNLYSREAVLGAAYIFTDRCYVLLDAPEKDKLSVELKARTSLDQEALEVIAGEFGNELLSQTLREVVSRQHQPH